MRGTSTRKVEGEQRRSSRPSGFTFHVSRPLRQSPQSLAGNAKDRAVVERDGTHRLVEPDGRLVPIQRRPFVTAPIALVRDACNMQKQRAAAPLAPVLGLHEDVFEPQAAPPEKRREIVEEHGETDSVVVLESEQSFSSRTRAEQRVLQRRLSRRHQVRQALVFGESSNEVEQYPAVVDCRGTDREHVNEPIGMKERCKSIGARAFGQAPRVLSPNRRLPRTFELNTPPG